MGSVPIARIVTGTLQGLFSRGFQDPLDDLSVAESHTYHATRLSAFDARRNDEYAARRRSDFDA